MTGASRAQGMCNCNSEQGGGHSSRAVPLTFPCLAVASPSLAHLPTPTPTYQHMQPSYSGLCGARLVHADEHDKLLRICSTCD